MSMFNIIEPKLAFFEGELKKTDIYIDRYLPCKILNYYKDICLEAFGDYNDKKNFSAALDMQFKECHAKIVTEENFDLKKNAHKDPRRAMCSLQKRHYSIPKIDILATLDYDEEDDEDDVDEEDEEESSNESEAEEK